MSSTTFTRDERRVMLCAELLELEGAAAVRALDQQYALWLTVSHVARKLRLYLTDDN